MGWRYYQQIELIYGFEQGRVYVVDIKDEKITASVEFYW